METRNNFLIKCHIIKSYLSFGVRTRATRNQRFGLLCFFFNKQGSLLSLTAVLLFHDCAIENFAITTNVAIFLAVSMVT